MITFLLTYVPNPRMNKRIGLAKKNDSVSVICVSRKGQNLWEPFHQDVPHNILELEMPSIRHPARRLFAFLHFFRYAVRQLKQSSPDIIFCAGIDCLLIAVLFSLRKRISIIYEVSDIRECYLANRTDIITRFFPAFEKLLLKKVSLLVITSEMFFDAYYRNLIDREKVLYIPNSPDLRFFHGYEKRPHEKFTIGFIGGIRYLNQLKMLLDAGAQLDDVRIFIAGGSGESDMEARLKDYAQGKKNITFLGRYDYAAQIRGLYEMADCIYSVYDADNPNVRIALPNKLYEAVYCELPIIVAAGTNLANIVNKYGVGISVPHNDVGKLTDEIRRLAKKDSFYLSIVKNCHDRKQEILFSDALNRLENRLRSERRSDRP